MNEEDDLPIDEESGDDQINQDEKPLSKLEQIAANREKELIDEFESEPEPEPIKKVKVKIDGVEEEKDLDEIISVYQKTGAADKRLQEASLKQKQLDEEWAALQQAKATFEKEYAEKQNVNPPVDISELKSKRREALEIGDYEEFDRLDEEIASLRYKPAKEVDAEKIKQEASQSALDKIEYNNAYEKFKSTNEDLLNDNVLYRITSETFNNVVSQSKTYQEAFDTTEKLVREWVNNLTPTKQDNTMAERVERKKSIPSEPGRLTVKNTLPEEKEESVSDVIKNIRKARGLPV